jgi:hypothetical protein
MFTTSHPKTRLAVLGIVAVALVTALAVTASPAQAGEKYFARAVNMGSIGAGRSTTLQITIDRWTTDEERNKLLGVVTQYANEKRGQEELVKALQASTDVGNVQFQGAAAMSSGFPSTRLYYAREFPTEEGRTIVLATDRPISGQEAMSSAAVSNYPISVIVLDLDKEGKGSGTLNIAVQVLWDEKTGQIKFGQYTTEPIRLTKVAPKKGT